MSVCLWIGKKLVLKVDMELNAQGLAWWVEHLD
jgi:hypothetical protein